MSWSTITEVFRSTLSEQLDPAKLRQEAELARQKLFKELASQVRCGKMYAIELEFTNELAEASGFDMNHRAQLRFQEMK